MTRLESILEALGDAFGWKEPKAPEMMKIGPGTETVDGALQVTRRRKVLSRVD